jgi:hypothetical protein
MPRKSGPTVTARLVWFIDGEPKFEEPGPNRDAAEQVVAEMRKVKAMKAGDEALVMAFVQLAEAVDKAPADARLWAQYRDAATWCREVAREAGAARDQAKDWTEVVGASKVRNTAKPRARKPRASGGRGQSAVGQGPDAVPAARVGRSARAR